MHQSIGIQNSSFDLSGMGRGTDAPSLAGVQSRTNNAVGPNAEQMIEDDGTMVVRHMPQDLFRSKLVEHFQILFRKNQIKWPSRC